MLEVYVSKENFKFNCAHFIAYKGFRERLHGHNYRVGVKVRGSRIGSEGYLMDFGDVKEATRSICSSLNEFFLCPANSDVINITSTETNVCLLCEDGSSFSFPKTDCMMLPVRHTSAEEIAHFLFCQLVRKIGFRKLRDRGITFMEVDISEAEKQTAIFRHDIPTTEEEFVGVENCLFGSQSCAISPCLEIQENC